MNSTNDSRLLIIGIPQRIRWALYKQFTRLPFLNRLAIQTDDPRLYSSQQAASAPQNTVLAFEWILKY
jgi:hypothetical protein